MNDATQVTSQQYLAWEHPFNLPLVLLFAIGCLALMLWTLYRERNILGRKWTSLFLLLRVIAILVVLWMLLGPTDVREEHTTTQKAVVVFSDASASMTVVDPLGTADELRWAAFQSKESQPTQATLLVSIDQGAAALGIAQRELSAAAENLLKHGADKVVAENIRIADQSIERAKEHIETIRTVLLNVDATTESDYDGLAQRAGEILESPEFDALSELAVSFRKHRSPQASGWRESLPDWIRPHGIGKKGLLRICNSCPKRL